MIDLHYWPTPNGHKITLFLEETGLPYRIVPVDIGRGEQFRPEFLAIAPNNRMPAIVDRAPADGGQPISLFESGAILLYLAEKAGRFIPTDIRGRAEVLQWLFWQMGGLGPMAGQNHHFAVYAPERIPYAIDRYVNETNRLYGVLDTRLADRPFVAGEDYSIADMASYPWTVGHERQGQKLADFPNLERWFRAIEARPATIRAYEIGQKHQRREATMDDEAKRVMFGADGGDYPAHCLMTMMLKLNVILSSTRPGRVGATVARWFHGVATDHGKFASELVDLAQLELPLYDEPRHPVLQKYEHEHTKRWGASVAGADAFVFVMPEYNHATTPALLNALDYVYKEWNYKPAAFVSYGGASGGIRAVQFIKPMLNALKLVPLVEAVMIPMVAQHLDESRQFKPGEAHLNAANAMLDELLRWAEALKPMRVPA